MSNENRAPSPLHEENENDRRSALIPAEESLAPPAQTAEVEKKLGMSMLTKIALVVLVLSSFIISISCVMKANQLTREAEEMKNEIAVYKEGIREIKDLIDREVDDEYIAEIARKYFDMYFPDEDVFYNDVND